MAGALSFCLVASPISPCLAASLELATQLFVEGNWEQCRVECHRAIATDDHSPTAHLLNALALRRSGTDSIEPLRALCNQGALSGEQLALAQYELGSALRDKPKTAFPYLLKAFRGDGSREIFARSSLLLADIVDRKPELARETPGLEAQLLACRPLWTLQMYRELENEPKDKNGRWSGKPGEWLIAFYRSQIRPTIANRCTLEPSCSEYMRQALRKHGALGFAIYGDRGVREPEVVTSKQSPVRIDGQTRYRDPLHDHDWWMEK